MTFLVILIALLIERFFDWSHLRHWGWFVSWQRMIGSQANSLTSYLGLAIAVLPVILVIFGLQLTLQHSFYGILEFVFQLLLFLYCLGPQNLWADTLACVHAFHHNDVSLFSKDSLTKESVLTPIFIAAQRRIFACVFWYLLAGPVAVVLYRAIDSIATNDGSEPGMASTVNAAQMVESLLDFIPVRILALLFALAGHFANVMTCWKSIAIFKLNMNVPLLVKTGEAALGVDELNQLSDEAAVKNVLAFLDRVFIISVVILALTVIMG